MRTSLLLLSFLLATTATLAQTGENDFSYNIGTGFNGPVYASALQSDGRLIVGGAFTSFNGTSRNRIARLNADGTLDNMFSPGTGFNGTVYSIAIQPADGKIIVVGDFTSFNGNNQNDIFRLNANGSYDNTLVTTGTGLNNLVYSVALQNDGKIIVGGLFTSYNGTSRNYIARLDAAGTLDATFDPGTGFNNWVRSVAFQSDGSILAGGDFTSYAGTTRNYIARVGSTGTLDAAFAPTVPGKIYAIKIQSGGKIVTGGSNSGTSDASGRVMRFLSNGGTDGFSVLLGASCRSLAVQTDDKILIGTNCLLRYASNGTGDTFVATPGFEGTPSINTITIQSDGSVIAAGEFSSYYGIARGKIARLTTCGVSITTQPSPAIICVGNNTSFTTVASGSGLTYKWQWNTSSAGIYTDVMNDATYSGAAGSVLSVTGATAGMSGYYYRCLISNGTCTTTSQPQTLTVQTVPTISVHPSNATACDGTNTSFSVTSTGLSFKWQYDDGTGYKDWQFSGANLATLPVNGVTANMNGYKFRCVVGSCSPSVLSNEATLTVNGGPSITTQPVTTSLCNSGNTSFSVVATGAVSYKWQKNSVDLSNAGIYSGVTTATLTITGATTTDNNTVYRCIVTGSNTCTTTSAAAILYVYSTPVISTQPANSSKCSGTSTTFTVAVTSPPAGLTYQWQEKVGAGAYTNLVNGGVYSNVTAATLNLNGLTTALSGNKYRCVVGVCSSPVVSFEADLVVDAPAVITQQPVNTTICSGMTTTFSTAATGVGLNFKWQKETSDGSSVYADLTDGGVYSGVGTETLTLTNATETLNNIRFRCVVLASGVCAAVNTTAARLTVRPIPTFNSQPVDITKCNGQTASFSVSTNNAFNAFQWQVDTGSGFTDLVAGTEYTTVTAQTLSFVTNVSKNGYKYRCRVGSCTPAVYSSAATLTAKESPVITTQPVGVAICAGGTATFSIAATGTDLTYAWSGATGSGANTATYTISNVTASLNGTSIHCVVKGGCSNTVVSEEVKLTVNQTRVDQHPEQPSNLICPGGSVTFSTVGSGPGAVTYQWQEDSGNGFTNITNGGVYSGVTSASLTLTNVPGSMKNFKYRGVVTSSCGEANTNPVTLQIYPDPPKPIINLSDDGTLTATGETLKWYKDGDLVAGVTSNTYVVTSEGSYTVQVTQNGCLSPMSDPKIVIITGDLIESMSHTQWVYPNPATHTINVSLKSFSQNEEVAILISDMLGRTMTTATSRGGVNKEFDIHLFPSGRYVVAVKGAHRNAVTQFVKTH